MGDFFKFAPNEPGDLVLRSDSGTGTFLDGKCLDGHKEFLEAPKPASVFAVGSELCNAGLIHRPVMFDEVAIPLPNGFDIKDSLLVIKAQILKEPENSTVGVTDFEILSRILGTSFMTALQQELPIPFVGQGFKGLQHVCLSLQTNLAI